MFVPKHADADALVNPIKRVHDLTLAAAPSYRAKRIIERTSPIALLKSDPYRSEKLGRLIAGIVPGFTEDEAVDTLAIQRYNDMHGRLDLISRIEGHVDTHLEALDQTANGLSRSLKKTLLQTTRRIHEGANNAMWGDIARAHKDGELYERQQHQGVVAATNEIEKLAIHTLSSLEARTKPTSQQVADLATKWHAVFDVAMGRNPKRVARVAQWAVDRRESEDLFELAEPVTLTVAAIKTVLSTSQDSDSKKSALASLDEADVIGRSVAAAAALDLLSAKFVDLYTADHELTRTRTPVHSASAFEL